MRRLGLLLLLPALLASPALTASSAVPPGSAGAGTGVISGYAVSSISYSFEDETIDTVSFALSPGGTTTVKARIAPREPWASCTVAGSVATCAVDTPVASASALEVVAAE
jgi:hypothetical protein